MDEHFLFLYIYFHNSNLSLRQKVNFLSGAIRKKWMCKTEKWKKKSIHCSLGLGAPPPGAGSRRWHSQSKDELLRDEKAAHKDLIA